MKNKKSIIWVIIGAVFIGSVLVIIFYSFVSATPGVNWYQATSNAGWDRTRFASVVFNNKIWFFGGYNGTSPYMHNDVWYSTDGVNWTQATASAAWSGRYGLTAVVFNGKMWIMGGNTGGDTLSQNDVWYSTDGINWTQATASAAWPVRDGHTSLVYDNKMWVMGGRYYDGEEIIGRNDVWYSTDGVNWTQATSGAWTYGKIDHSSVVYDNKMWVMGGYYWIGYYNDVWYSTNGAAWTRATASADWSARVVHASAVFDNKMWVMGGVGEATGLNDAWYSTNGINWTQASTGVAGLIGYPVSVVFDRKMWALGGGSGNNDTWYSY